MDAPVGKSCERCTKRIVLIRHEKIGTLERNRLEDKIKEDKVTNILKNILVAGGQ